LYSEVSGDTGHYEPVNAVLNLLFEKHGKPAADRTMAVDFTSIGYGMQS
jgi:hypothetical protein